MEKMAIHAHDISAKKKERKKSIARGLVKASKKRKFSLFMDFLFSIHFLLSSTACVCTACLYHHRAIILLLCPVFWYAE
jgi:hypothetical protein